MADVVHRRFRGPFPMRWLNLNERVGSAGDGTGAVVIETPRGLVRLERGQRLVRHDDGSLEARAGRPTTEEA